MAFQILHEFFDNPQFPTGPLVQGSDGSFYSVSSRGGDFGEGTIFRITSQSDVTILYSFEGAESFPYINPSCLIHMADGSFYGVASGFSNVLFRFDVADASVHQIVSFDSSFGGRLISDGVGHLYGASYYGGDNNLGSVFCIATNGDFSTLFSFNGTNGANPIGRPTLGVDGNLYGTTSLGGSNYTGGYSGHGTVFKLTTNGIFNTLVYFDGTNGRMPTAGLTFGADHCLFGTTHFGGTNGGYGTVFRLTTNGVLTTMAAFDGINGSGPSEVMQGVDGKFYGFTAYTEINGVLSNGTVFSVTTNGELKTLFRFDGTNALHPLAEPMMAHDGNLYGVTKDIELRPSLNGNSGLFFRFVQVPKITSLVQSGEKVTLQWSTFTNGIYRVEHTPSITAVNWTAVSSDLTANGRSLSFTNSAGATQDFYRIVLLLPQSP